MNFYDKIVSLVTNDEDGAGIDIGTEPSKWHKTILTLRAAASMHEEKNMSDDEVFSKWLEDNCTLISIYDSEILLSGSNINVDYNDRLQLLDLILGYEMGLDSFGGLRIISVCGKKFTNESLSIAVMNAIFNLSDKRLEIGMV